MGRGAAACSHRHRRGAACGAELEGRGGSCRAGGRPDPGGTAGHTAECCGERWVRHQAGSVQLKHRRNHPIPLPKYSNPPPNLRKKRKGVQTPIPHPYPTAPSTAMASAAPRLARMAAMTTAVLLRRAGVGSMVLRLRAGRAQGEGWHPGLGWHGDIGELFSPSVLGWRHGGHSPTPSGTSPQEDGVGPLRLRFGATAAHQQELHPAGWAPLAPVRGRHDAPSHCLTCRAPGRAAAHCRVPGRGTPCPRRPAARLHRELSIRRRLPPSAVSCRRGRWAAPRMGAPRRWMWGF